MAENGVTPKEKDISSVMKQKLQAVFNEADINGNKLLDAAAFSSFVQKTGCGIEESSTEKIFKVIPKSKDEGVSVEDLYKYLTHVSQFYLTGFDAERPLSEDEKNFAIGLFRSEVLPFREFTEYVWSKQGEAVLPQLRSDIEDEGNEMHKILQFEEFQQQKDEEGTDSTDGSDEELRTAGSKPFHKITTAIHKGTKKLTSFLLKQLKDVEKHDIVKSEEDTKQLKDSEKHDVKSGEEDAKISSTEEEKKKSEDVEQNFFGFQRLDSHDQPVMRQKGEYHKIIQPGQHKLMSLAFYSDLGSEYEPKHATARGVSWEKGRDGKPGKLVFPPDFNVEIPTVMATEQYLSYYGCFFANHDQAKISMVYKHQLIDFEYGKGYLDHYVTHKDKNNGASLERHEFQHLDCPLQEKSGVLVIGKFVDEEESELHLTGFHVPPLQTVYIPSNTIHINDYLQGMWRTMLAAEKVPIDSVKLVKDNSDSTSSGSENEKTDGAVLEPIVLSFEKLAV